MFENLIINRRSTRKFTDETLTSEEVHKILQAALLAPTAKNGKSWEFVAVDDRSVITQLARCKDSGAIFLETSTLAVAVLGNRTATDTWVEDASISATYMQLQAEDLDIGSCWCHIRDRFLGERHAEDVVREILNIPYEYGVLCIIGFGRKNQERKPNDLSKLTWEKIHINTFFLADCTPSA
ncbi:MAG: nitroreductase family protein [Tannerella sp.]|jgi:nitroreductase|nr:nitroreductase family protein [Tannerella sp.]